MTALMGYAHSSNEGALNTSYLLAEVFSSEESRMSDEELIKNTMKNLGYQKDRPSSFDEETNQVISGKYRTKTR